MDVPLSWRTDIAVLVASGSSVEEHADHLVVRTPTDPTYDWGNFVMVTDPATVDDAARWEAVFTSSFPDAGHRAIGLPVEPTDVAALGGARPRDRARGRAGPRRAAGAATAGRGVRRTAAVERRDWAAVPRRSRRGCHGVGCVDGGNAVFLGAFAGDELAADLGILDCGAGVARYQDVMTRPRTAAAASPRTCSARRPPGRPLGASTPG